MTWRVRFTDASDRPGLAGDFDRLRDAKAEARRLLEADGKAVGKQTGPTP